MLQNKQKHKIILQRMNRPVSQIRCGNRLIQQKQDTLSLQKHYRSLRRTRPMTGNTIDRNAVLINNKKREMVQQNRFTQIERENRILFQKITSIMHKGTISQTIVHLDRPPTALNKTLNGGYRKKQMQSIQLENAQMLKRLKDKKSTYGVAGLHREWQKKKKVIQNMSIYPFILNDNMGAQTKKSRANQAYLMKHNYMNQANKSIELPKQIRRIRKINGLMFLITIKFDNNQLFIIGDIKQEQSIKVIELQKKQAEQFIYEECNGNIQNIFGMLRYDRESGDLYLVGRNIGELQDVKEFETSRRRVVSQHETRNKRNFTQIIPRCHLPPRPLSKQLSRNNANFNNIENNEEQESILSLQQDLNKVKLNNNEADISLGKNIQNIDVENNMNDVAKQRQQVEQSNKKSSQWVKKEIEKDQQLSNKIQEDKIQSNKIVKNQQIYHEEQNQISFQEDITQQV